MQNKAIFLDRDGVINEDKGYIGKVQDFIFFPEIFTSLKKLQSNGYLLIVVTNQAGIAKGYFSEKEYHKLDEYMIKELEKSGIIIKKTYYCPHSPEENCECRKPKPGLIYQAQRDYDIDLTSSWVIGDKLSDILAGKRAGCKTILIDSEYVKGLDMKKFNNLNEACEYILKNNI